LSGLRVAHGNTGISPTCNKVVTFVLDFLREALNSADSHTRMVHIIALTT
jgi:hypothetical protein